nr:streptococcal hemagglutinin-like [Pocillopora verrucosa]
MNASFFLAFLFTYLSISGKSDADFRKENPANSSSLPMSVSWSEPMWNQFNAYQKTGTGIPAPPTTHSTPQTLPALQLRGQGAPVAEPVSLPRRYSVCPMPTCSFPSICVKVAVYATCVPPPNPSASTNNSCSTPGPCLTTVTKTATDTKTLVSTSTQTETSTAIATITNTKTTTNTALTTQTHTQTDVVTATSTLTTTNTQVATSTHHTTETSTAVTTSHLPVTSTKTLTATSTRIVNTTDTHTLTTTDVIRTTETSTNIVTRTANKTNTHTLTTTKTDTVTSTGITTSTLLTTATATNTVNTTHLATKTLTETLTTVATQTSTSMYNATNVITATTTSTATATSTAVLTATSTAKTTETLTATSTAVLTQTLTNTHNQTLTQTKTLTATSTSVVTTCSASCLTVVPTTTPLPPTPPTPKPPVCEQALDIGVIIDASESVKLPNYKLCLQFVANLTEHFKVSQKGTHFGSIVYSSDAELQFSFKDIQYHDAESLKKKIKSFPYLREGTRTDIALELANTLLFSVQGGDRFDKPDVLIVITDGLTDPERSKPYPVVLKPLEDKKVVVIAVGVGKEVNKPELTSIAMGDVNHVFMVDQYTDLVKIINALLDKSCSAATQPKMVPSKAVALVKNQEHYDGECPVQFIKKGCFNAIKSQKPLPRLMFTDLDARDSKFSGVPIDWGSWNSYLQNVVCRCAQVSKAEGFYYFGVKNFGECWSGENLDITYSKDDSSEFCISKEFAECDTNDRNVCGGNATTTYIYRMPKESEAKQGKRCFTKFKNVGCFADMQTSSRPIPELIFTDLDESSTKYSGHKAQLGELDTYLSDLLCRCAELTQELGYEYFGLQNHGECYSGPSVQHTYSKDGSSKKCITRNFKQCPAGKKYENKDGQDYCVGAQGANYVYRV